MSVASSSLVWEHSRAAGNDLLVLHVIADHDGEGGSWPSIGTIARKARVSDSTARRCIRNLVHLGEITIHERRGGTLATRQHERTNLYEITIDPTRQPVDNTPGQAVDNSTPPVTGDRGAPVTTVTPPPCHGYDTRTTQEPPIEPSPLPPAVPILPESVARLWDGEGISRDDQDALWAAVIADPDTTVPAARARQRAWYVPTLAKIHAAHGKGLGAALAQVRRFGAPCEHDEPGGLELHPTTGLPLCPLCRAKASA